MNYGSLSNRLAAEVRAEMARQRIGLQGLAEKLPFSYSTLHRRLAGKSVFTVDEVDLVAEALGVSAASLYEAAERAHA